VDKSVRKGGIGSEREEIQSFPENAFTKTGKDVHQVVDKRRKSRRE